MRGQIFVSAINRTPAMEPLEDRRLFSSIAGDAISPEHAEGWGEGGAALRTMIAFTSTRSDPGANQADRERFWRAGEIYLMNPDGSGVKRLTNNEYADAFANFSPDGKLLVFDSNRLRDTSAVPPEPLNTSDLFVTDGRDLSHLVRGSSPSWDPDSSRLAFHASASGEGLPVIPDPGAATTDSDIFVLDVHHAVQQGAQPVNLTNDPTTIDDDPEWSPVIEEDGRRVEKIGFTSHPAPHNATTAAQAEVYVMNTDGSGRVRLTHNDVEERAVNWSPDGARIVYMSRRGGPDFEIFVMNSDGTGEVQLTNNNTFDGSPQWSPDGHKILFSRNVAGRQQIFVMNTDGSGVTQLTDADGANLLPTWARVRVQGESHFADLSGSNADTVAMNVPQPATPGILPPQPLAPAGSPISLGSGEDDNLHETALPA